MSDDIRSKTYLPISGREDQLTEVTPQQIAYVIADTSVPALIVNEENQDIYNYICHVMNFENLSTPNTIQESFQLYRRLHHLIHY